MHLSHRALSSPSGACTGSHKNAPHERLQTWTQLVEGAASASLHGWVAPLQRAAVSLLPLRPQPFRFSFPQREAAWPGARFFLSRGSCTPVLLPSAARRKRQPERGPLEQNRRWDANDKELLHLRHTASRVASDLCWAAGPAWLPPLCSGPGWTSCVFGWTHRPSILCPSCSRFSLLPWPGAGPCGGVSHRLSPLTPTPRCCSSKAVLLKQVSLSHREGLVRTHCGGAPPLHFLIQWFWARAREFAFLSSSPGRLLAQDYTLRPSGSAGVRV